MAGLRTTVPRLLHQTFSHAAPGARLHLARPNVVVATCPATTSTARLFSSATPRLSPLSSKPTSPFAALTKRFAHPNTTRGVATTPYGAQAGRSTDQVDWTRVATSAGIAFAGVVGVQYFLNRETRGGLSPYESAYLNETFRWSGGGLVITAGIAKLLHSNGFAARMMATNPWLVMGLGVAAGIGSMLCIYNTASDSPLHYVSWAVFSAVQGATLAPMFFLNPAVLSRAGLYTLGALGGLTWVGATARSDQFLYIGGPLLAGLGVLVVASLAPMVLPRMSMRTMTVLESCTAYGGVGLFSAFILYDTQKILAHASLAQRGAIPRDPLRESVSLILDAINLFVRIVQVMLLQQSRKK